MKKFLSMALALVMTLSLCTFVNTTKADAAFADVDELSSQYAEQAADVIQTIEVMDGYDDGTFRPTAGLTRQAAAKIICNMILGPTTARALPTNANPFPDVLAGNQFSGYISYCAQQGIISGYADGTFRPGDPLSGYAYLKMLLGALGYSATQEGYVGDNWKVNVAKTALGIGLDKGIAEELDGTTQVTREAAAIYAFNTLQADMVEYDTKNTIEVNGVKLSVGGGNAVPQTWGTSATSAGNISLATDTGFSPAQGGRPIVQFAERYFDKLERRPNGAWDNNGKDDYTQDDFGRPAVKWIWKGVDIGTYTKDPDATFVGGVKVNEIYEALRQNAGMSSGSNSASLYVNSSEANRGWGNNYAGQPNGYGEFKVERANDKDLADEIAKTNTGFTVATANDKTGQRVNAAGAGIGRNVDRIGDGTLIEVFLNEANNHVDVCVISVYGGKVASVKGATTKKDAYVTIDAAKTLEKRPDRINSNVSNREYETEDFDVDDVVAYTYSDSAQEIKSMYLLTAESGALESKVMTKSLKLNGTTYKYAKEYDFDEDLTEQNLSNKSSYVVYLDANDYVLWVEEDEFSVDDYVLIERITIETTVNNTTTKTASVLGNAEANTGYTGANSANLQKSYNQSKDPVGNSSWDAQAQIRYSTGTRRTVTLDDSKNYRTSAASDTALRNQTSAYYASFATQGGAYSWNAITGVYDYVPNYQPPGSDETNATNLAWFDADGKVQYDSAANAAANGWTVRATVADVGPFLELSGTTNGDGDGNWVAEPFTAGHIVRLSSNSDGYRLHSIQDSRFEKVDNFVIINGKIGINGVTANDPVSDSQTGRKITVDSETHFVVEDVAQGTYKSYYGSKNAPDVNYRVNPNGSAATDMFGNRYYDATAYIYHNNGAAKLVFVTNSNHVTSSSNDIVFLAANSTSKLVENDDGFYYEVSAVEKNEIKTLMIKTNVSQTLGVNFPVPGTNGTVVFRPDTASTQEKDHCVILNNYNTDSNDFIISGTFQGKDTADRVKGIRRVNSEEVRLDTAANGANRLYDVADSIRVYFVDGDDITQIGYDEIDNDTMDWVYYVQNDDSEITYLFIVDCDDEDTVNTATIPVNANGYFVANAGYSLIPSTTSVAAGSSVTFQVYDVNGVLQTSNEIQSVTATYTRLSGGQDVTTTFTAYPDAQNVFTVTFSSDLKNDSTISFKVNPVVNE